MLANSITNRRKWINYLPKPKPDEPPGWRHHPLFRVHRDGDLNFRSTDHEHVNSGIRQGFEKFRSHACERIPTPTTEIFAIFVLFQVYRQHFLQMFTKRFSARIFEGTVKVSSPCCYEQHFGRSYRLPLPQTPSPKHGCCGSGRSGNSTILTRTWFWSMPHRLPACPLEILLFLHGSSGFAEKVERTSNGMLCF